MGSSFEKSDIFQFGFQTKQNAIKKKEMSRYQHKTTRRLLDCHLECHIQKYSTLKFMFISRMLSERKIIDTNKNQVK